MAKKKVKKPSAKQSLKLSRKIPATMKARIEKQLLSSSRVKNGIVTGLKKPTGLSATSKKISGCGMGADKNGFFLHTHRARSKSRVNPSSFTKKEIDFIESTG